MNQVADRYAQALFMLAQEEGTIASLKDEAVSLKDACSRDLVRLLDVRSVTKDEKKALFAECLPGANRHLLNFLYLLVDEGRAHYLPQILDRFVALCNEAQNIQEVTVVSARPLTSAEQDEIVRAIGSKYGKDVEIHNEIDESLIAGTRISINGRVYDSSLKTKIRSLREELLRESW